MQHLLLVFLGSSTPMDDFWIPQPDLDSWPAGEWAARYWRILDSTLEGPVTGLPDLSSYQLSLVLQVYIRLPFHCANLEFESSHQTRSYCPETRITWWPPHEWVAYLKAKVRWSGQGGWARGQRMSMKKSWEMETYATSRFGRAGSVRWCLTGGHDRRIWTMGRHWIPRWSSALDTTSSPTPGRHKGFTARLSHVRGCRQPGPEHRRHSARATTGILTARAVLGDRIEGNKVVWRNGRCNDDAETAVDAPASENVLQGEV